MPLGIRCSAVFTPLITKVWPALCPPLKRTTPCALCVSQSTSLPLPSSPHWVPTTTTLRPLVAVIQSPIQMTITHCIPKNHPCTSSASLAVHSYCLRPAFTFTNDLEMESDRLHDPAARDLRQFTVTVELIDFALMSWQDADHRFPCGTQFGDCSVHNGRFPPRGANGPFQCLRWHHTHHLLDVQAQSDRRAVAAKRRAHFVIAPRADQCIAGPTGIDRKTRTPVVSVAAQIRQVEGHLGAFQAGRQPSQIGEHWGYSIDPLEGFFGLGQYGLVAIELQQGEQGRTGIGRKAVGQRGQL